MSREQDILERYCRASKTREAIWNRIANLRDIRDSYSKAIKQSYDPDSVKTNVEKFIEYEARRKALDESPAYSAALTEFNESEQELWQFYQSKAGKTEEEINNEYS